jgi:DNA polymerase III gamma/tau subunit
MDLPCEIMDAFMKADLVHIEMPLWLVASHYIIYPTALPVFAVCSFYFCKMFISFLCLVVEVLFRMFFAFITVSVSDDHNANPNARVQVSFALKMLRKAHQYTALCFTILILIGVVGLAYFQAHNFEKKIELRSTLTDAISAHVTEVVKLVFVVADFKNSTGPCSYLHGLVKVDCLQKEIHALDIALKDSKTAAEAAVQKAEAAAAAEKAAAEKAAAEVDRLQKQVHDMHLALKDSNTAAEKAEAAAAAEVDRLQKQAAADAAAKKAAEEAAAAAVQAAEEAAAAAVKAAEDAAAQQKAEEAAAAAAQAAADALAKKAAEEEAAASLAAAKKAEEEAAAAAELAAAELAAKKQAEEEAAAAEAAAKKGVAEAEAAVLKAAAEKAALELPLTCTAFFGAFLFIVSTLWS